MAGGRRATGAVLINTSVGLTYVAMGWLLIERQRGNAVGVLLLAVGFTYAVAGPLDWYLSIGSRDGPARDYAALVYLLAGTPISICLGLAVILFPDGRLPSRRWRWPVLVLMVAISLGGFALAFGVSTFAPVYPALASPFGIPGFPKRTLQTIADLAGQAALVVGFLALIVRWRRGGPTERAQVKWVIAAASAMVATNVAASVAWNRHAWTWEATITGLLQNIAVTLLPIAMAVAITRYHLYDIDRIVSRSIAYVVVTAVLVAVVGSLILILQSLISGAVAGPGSELDPLVVAASTLVVAALFNPLRTRVQAIVDRRFHRSHYDAERTVAGFAGRLRDQLDLPTLTGELRRTTTRAVEPATTEVWLRARGGAG